jgi:hypothetical protein
MHMNAIIRRMAVAALMIGASGLMALTQARAAASSERQMQSEAERIVSQYQGVFTNPPTGTPSRGGCDGPLLGNGNLGAAISGNPEAQRFWIGKNNVWRLRDGHRIGGPSFAFPRKATNGTPRALWG